MSDNVKVGELCSEFAERDAIHMAIAPVIAGENLEPGIDVGLNKDRKAVSFGECIGIVDPFLRRNVKRGERFYLFLYPGTITSLRHEWKHKSFCNNEREESVVWLEDFAYEVNKSFDELLKIGHKIAADGYAYVGDDHAQSIFYERKREFLFHIGRIINIPDLNEKDVGFSCAC